MPPRMHSLICFQKRLWFGAHFLEAELQGWKQAVGLLSSRSLARESPSPCCLPAPCERQELLRTVDAQKHWHSSRVGVSGDAKKSSVLTVGAASRVS